jgi:hypothetical protein
LEQDRGWQPGAKARLLYDHLTRTASPEPRSEGLGSSPEDHRGPPGRLISSGRKLAADAGCAYSLCVAYLRELEEAGWLARVRHKHGDTEYILCRPIQATSTPEQATSQHAHEQPILQHMGDPSQPITEAQQHAGPQAEHRAGGSGVSGSSQAGDQTQHPQDELPQSDELSQSSDSEMNFENDKVQSVLPSHGGSDLPTNLCKNLNFEDSQSSEIAISGENSGLKVQCSKFKVQSSKFKVQPMHMYHQYVQYLLISSMHACMPKI